MTELASEHRPVRAEDGKFVALVRMLLKDPLAVGSAIILLIILLFAVVGPFLLSDAAVGMNLKLRNLAPFSLETNWVYFLGADSLGRSMLARIVVGARTTFTIALSAVGLAMFVGGSLGIIAGYAGRWTGTIILRLTDVIFSFPSLLLALIIIYIVGPSITNVIMILSFSRLPLYIRVTRSEVLELRQRTYVNAARAIGAGTPRILLRHIVPLVIPTIITLGALDFAGAVLAESGLSFLGLGVQAPDFTWGAMVSTGRNYLQTAWWLSFFPGLAIIITTLCMNILAHWGRTAADPQQRWRLQLSRAKSRRFPR
jgi:peptide/nickel transport system permease protein